MEHKRCYVYEPDSQQSAKRRRIEKRHGLHESWPIRRKYFEQAWAELDHKIEQELTAANNAVAEQIRHSLTALRSDNNGTKLPTCAISLEPGSRAKDVLTSLISKQAPDKSERHVVLDAADAPDLKSVLKKIIKQCSNEALEDIDDEDEDKQDQPSRPRARGLGYDLQILADEVEDIEREQYLVVVSNAEAVRPDVLSELIEYLALWLNRIPFALIICCAIPIDMLQRSLTQRALKKLNAEVAYAASCQDEIDIVIDCVMTADNRLPYIGPLLMRSFLQRQHDYLADVGTFVASLKYATMCACYANPLVIFSIGNNNKSSEAELCEALRTTNSFKRVITELVEQGQREPAAGLLDNDTQLHAHTEESIRQSLALVSRMYAVVGALAKAQSIVALGRESFRTTLWLQCLSGTLRGSTTLRHFHLSVRKASLIDIEKIICEFNTLQVTYENDMTQEFSAGFRSLAKAVEEALSAEQMEPAERNTMKQLGKTASLAADTAALLEDFLNSHLRNPKDLPFHEIWLYDSPSPCREVFTPRPRHAVERALASPHDYLDCDCCATEHGDDGAADGSLSATQPATAVLYQLYLESGNMINVHDAWQAFSAILGEETAEEQKMALFQRSLADLRHLGMVKSTRRRVDHIAKTAWKGL